MKKLICSLMTIIMLFSTAISVAGASFNYYSHYFAEPSDSDNTDYEGENSQESPPSTPRIRPRPECLTLRDEQILRKELYEGDEAERFFLEMKKIYDDAILNGTDENTVVNIFTQIIRFIENNVANYSDEVKNIALTEFIFYLAGSNIINKLSVNNFISYLSCGIINDSLEDEDGRWRVIESISDICKNNGLICILGTGDVVDSNGKIYDCYGDEYSEIHHMTSRNNLCPWEHWLGQKFILKGNCFYGIFITPDGEVLNCEFDNFTDLLDLNSIGTIIKGNLKIKVSPDGTVTLNNGTEIKTRKEIKMTLEFANELITKWSKAIFYLVRHASAMEFSKSLLDLNFSKPLENLEELFCLKNFVSKNFNCYTLSKAFDKAHQFYMTHLYDTQNLMF